MLGGGGVALQLVDPARQALIEPLGPLAGLIQPSTNLAAQLAARLTAYISGAHHE
jgi:hypothetical protein